MGEQLRQSGHTMFLAMPTPMRIWAAVGDSAPCPVTVREGREWLTGFAGRKTIEPLGPEQSKQPCGDVVLQGRELWFKYDKDLPDVVKGLSLSLRKGEFLALLGGNGTGKTTSLKLLSGLRKPYRGELEISGSVGDAAPEPPDPVRQKDGAGGPVRDPQGQKTLQRTAGPARSSCDGPVPAGGAAGPAPLRPLWRGAAAGRPGQGVAAGSGDFAAGRAYQRTGCGIQTGVCGDPAGPASTRRGGTDGQPRH